jgi:outer membrane protein OmpA-like peptidoglycan-associated protein
MSGHCDYIGNDRYNDSLSNERVKAAHAWLVSRGVPDSVFRNINDFGKRRPLNDNATDQKRRLNRRVEIVFNSAVPPGRSTPSLEAAFHDTAHLSGRKNIVLKNVTFYGDRHFPLPASYPVLQELRKALQNNPDIRVEIQGYVCCNGPDKDGYDEDTHTPDLSVQRAKYVYEYLIKVGIDSSRMTYRGFGARYPIYPKEENDLERTGNRRVELKILKK